MEQSHAIAWAPGLNYYMREQKWNIYKIYRNYNLSHNKGKFKCKTVTVDTLRSFPKEWLEIRQRKPRFSWDVYAQAFKVCNTYSEMTHPPLLFLHPNIFLSQIAFHGTTSDANHLPPRFCPTFFWRNVERRTCLENMYYLLVFLAGFLWFWRFENDVALFWFLVLSRNGLKYTKFQQKQKNTVSILMENL